MACDFLKRRYSTLEYVPSHKHLGLTINNNLKWTNHVNNIIADVSKMSDALKQLKYSVDRKTLELCTPVYSA